MSGVKWSEEDNGYLRGAWGRETTEELATHFGRSLNAVRAHAHEMGLPNLTEAKWQAQRNEAFVGPEEAAQAVLDTALKSWGRLAPILTKPPPQTKTKWGLHEAVLMLSDSHYGLKVDPVYTGGFGGYDSETAFNRCARLRDGVLEITAIHQRAMTIKRLNIFALGDDLEGHGQIYPSQAFFLDNPLCVQWLEYARMIEEFLKQLLEVFETIKVFKVFGNHGRIAKSHKDGHPQDNVELLLWRFVEARLQNEKRINFAISPSWWMLVRRMGWTFYLSHGADTLPWSPYAQRGAFNVKLRLNSLFPEKINYLCLAHHHVSLEIERELEGSILYNGSWVGPTDYALRGLHEANRPSQLYFLVHPRFGVRAVDKIRLAELKDVRRVQVDEE